MARTPAPSEADVQQHRETGHLRLENKVAIIIGSGDGGISVNYV